MGIKPKILFVHTLSSGVTYWRFVNFIKYMKRSKELELAIFPEYDVNVVFIPEWEMKYESKDKKFHKYVCDLFESADILVFQAIHKYKSLATMDALINHANKKVICEMDDYIFGIPSDHIASSTFYPNSLMEDLQWKQMLVSQSMIVSTPYLKKMYGAWNKDIHVIPNAIDFEVWKPKRRRKNANIRIGYVGGQQHNKDLYVLREIIPKINRKVKDITWIIWGGHPDLFSGEHEGLKKVCEFPQWTRIDKYPDAYRNKNFDIVISPLLDNDLNRGKSNLKWLEASALKIPFVGSKVEPYTRSIVHGYTGFIADNVDSWVEILLTLIRNDSLRKRIGQNAYKEVYENWNAEKVSQDYIRVLKNIGRQKFKNTYRDLRVEENVDKEVGYA